MNLLSRSKYKINIDGVQNRRKLFHADKKAYKEEPQSRELITFEDDNIQNLTNNINLEQNITDFSILCQKQSIVKSVTQEQDNSKKYVEDPTTHENQEHSKQLDMSQSLSKYAGSPIIARKNNNITPRTNRFSSRKITRREINIIHSFANKNQHNGANGSFRMKASSEKLELSNNGMFNQEAEKEYQPSYFKLVSFMYAYKFLKTILINYINKDIHFLSDLQINIINDKSSNFRKQQKNYKEIQGTTKKHYNIFERLSFLRNKENLNMAQKSTQLLSCIEELFSTILIFLKFFIKSIKIINPNNILLKLWDLIFLSHQYIIFILYPFYFSFFQDNSNQQLHSIMFYLQKVQLISSGIDILLSSHTGIYVFGEVVLNREQIYAEYASKQLLQDLFCIIFMIFGILTGYGFPSFFSLLLRIGSVNKIYSFFPKIKIKLMAYLFIQRGMSSLLKQQFNNFNQKKSV